MPLSFKTDCILFHCTDSILYGIEAKHNRAVLILNSGKECASELKDEVNISYEPFKEIAIMEYMRFKTSDDLARFLNIAAGGKPTGVYWTNGIAFFYYPMATTSETATKALIEQKKVYWAFVGFASMPEYKAIIETREKIMVPVVDMSSSPLFQKAALWLKERQ